MNTLNTKITQLKYIFIALLTVAFISCKNANTTNTSVGNLTSKMTKPDKKKYFDSSNSVVYEVKYKDDGFKLRTASSDLLWKVKLYDSKVKISDNEENLNPYEIKKMDTGESKLEKNDMTIERSTTEDARNLVYKIDEIPQDQQEILISELKEKGF
ncbi:hypothetical protein [Maribacter sp. 2308TA10-17]|uniref:hypothetical protein n=1 Tax=Maribacter sp. 2308TA10-17 TaxID=3386276 RepID=UPI0039BCDFD5